MKLNQKHYLRKVYITRKKTPKGNLYTLKTSQGKDALDYFYFYKSLGVWHFTNVGIGADDSFETGFSTTEMMLQFAADIVANMILEREGVPLEELRIEFVGENKIID